MGLRYAEDELIAEENLFRYTESDLGGLIAFWGGAFGISVANGGFVQSAEAAEAGNPFGLVLNEYGQPTPTPLAVNGGIPIAVSLYRPLSGRTQKPHFV